MSCNQTISPPASPISTSSDNEISPPLSRSSSRSSKGSRTPLSLDLSSVPSLIKPSSLSNTLIITNLSPALFQAAALDNIRILLSHSSPLHSFSPLKSLRRVIVSYPTNDAAIASAQFLHTTPLVTVHNARVYFGEPTPTEELTDRHLHAPKSQKLFFISPPPSPPHGWTSKDEGPPNKEVWAGDLAKALEGVRGARREEEQKEINGRRRSGSRSIVYDPQDHGDSPALPAVMVEDLTDGQEETLDVEMDEGSRVITHTTRPPVELMQYS